MDIIKKMIKDLDDNTRNDIYLREIAHLMEEIDALKGTLRVKENLIKNYEKQLKVKSDE